MEVFGEKKTNKQPTTLFVRHTSINERDQAVTR